MEKKRIGNDRHVRLAVTRNGRPETLEGKRLTLQLWCDIYTHTVEDYTVEGNVISFTWYGTDQKKTGKYFITLYENYGEKSQNVVDSRAFVQLVARSFMVHGDDGCGCDMDSPELSLAVDIDAPTGTTDYNDLENKPSINGVTLEGKLSLADLGITGGEDGGGATPLPGDVELADTSYAEDLFKDWDTTGLKNLPKE